MTSNIRPALIHEDELCSRILTNAFLPIWNHNWFQNISKPLAPVPLDAGSSLSPRQSARKRFYHSLIKSTRLLGGDILVNIVEGQNEEASQIGAILLWLPPHARMSMTSVGVMYRSGFLRTMYDYGFMGIHRISTVFEGNIAQMYKAADVNEVEFNFVQMLATNPEFRGRGLGEQLLRWRVERCTGREGVVLDTSTMQAVRIYQKMGFEIIGETPVKTGCDAEGIRLAKGQGEETKQVQMVMMLRQGGYIPVPVGDGKCFGSGGFGITTCGSHAYGH